MEGSDLRLECSILSSVRRAVLELHLEGGDVLAVYPELGTQGHNQRLESLRRAFPQRRRDSHHSRFHGNGIQRPARFCKSPATPPERLPRDYAILQGFLQTGIRVSELCDLLLTDIDLASRTLTVRAGKGMRSRVIALEKKGVQALKSYLAVRLETPAAHLFLNKYGQPLTERAIQLLVKSYREQAGISKPATPHSFRHTFGTYKAEKGVDVFQLRDWLGHKNLTTTQIYVHLARANSRKVMEATSL